ncbi:hypothetical protein SPRG_16575 [Saprolegnia parasitica CBS 223.65]|uniref:Eukaryotic translation initiation factor 4E n=1 Tax=Saprolegnia parasitica (strain CBS 223.65) TaxID=695850 RepID=A0A067BUT9_SAPPC|nr:hypothetical protein SPRG_16575 [Saprolegnia parasitica CBS 223.65]KDO18051.1 hypothetical protein SPRG_16575 [Saprolegnia parasitica CBS 223.65]|eukprot:XP_012211243.1 hypothetical protein SPRG_16575 [Saprolegnia parasitica CBS 223.65]
MATEPTETHALESAWSIWELRDSSKSNYGENLHRLCTFSSVEEFWGYWNNIPKPSQVLNDGVVKKKFTDRSVQSFAVFKDGIRPEWEDSANMSGGEWQLSIKLQAGPLDELWDKLVLGMIGETIDPTNEVTGARVVHKNKKDSHSYRFELWLRSRDRNLADEIRKNMVACLNQEGVNPTKVVISDCSYKEHRH